MKVLLVRAELARQTKESAEDKMRRIFQSHVDEAKTGDERKRARKALREFTRVDRTPASNQPWSFRRCPCMCEEHGPRVVVA
jgi:hypothetical protein